MAHIFWVLRLEFLLVSEWIELSDRPRPVFRFAPSPNGYLHLGHAASALINQRMACECNGRYLLRIEDIDVGRTREEYIAAIYEDLDWIGVGFEKPVLRQSENFEVYEDFAGRLAAMGLLYPCFASRAEIASAVETLDGGRVDPDGAPVYPGLHRGLSASEVASRKQAGQPFAMRIDMEKALVVVRERLNGDLVWREMDDAGGETAISADPMQWGDVILQRKEVPTSYHLSVVVDDANQGVSHIVRGEDLRQATSIHRLLQVLLDLPEPKYFHHGLVRDPDGKKLSKSDSATSLRSLREAGLSRDEVILKIDHGVAG